MKKTSNIGFLKPDEKTGKKYLKIPVTDGNFYQKLAKELEHFWRY